MNKSVQIVLPKKVKYIIDKLSHSGYEAFAVGGCVRDVVLGRVPNDWDITTSATPEQVKSIFKRTIDTGIEHGTVTVMVDREGFEVTTYRVDGEYKDGRHPDSVQFTPELREDLKRRDFTINAMAYNETEGLIDIFDGKGDIERKLIRCVGEAKERFKEDALRMMRAVRFSAQLGYDIEEDTKTAIKELAPTLKNISAERIQTELIKLVVSSNPDYLRTAYETGVTAVVLPEFDKMMETEQKNPHHCYSVGEHTLCAMKSIKADKVLRLAMLFHDVGKPETLTVDEEGISHFYGHPEVGMEMTRQIMRRLKFDNDTLFKVTKLVELHDHRPSLKKSSVRRLLVQSGTELFPELLKVKKADTLAQSEYLQEEKLKYLEELNDLYQEILKSQDCLQIKDLAINGTDLMKFGIPQGKQIGAILSEIFEMILEEPEKNSREYLMNFVKKTYL